VPSRSDALWELTWSGRVTGDTLAPLRGRLVGGRTSHRARTQPTPRGRYAAGRRRFAGLTADPTAHPGAAADLRRRGIPADVVGRWSLTPAIVTDPTTSAVAAAEVLLDRYGVLTRGSVTAEDVPGGFARIYRVLADAEAAGRVRRGYFVEGLGAAQFASTGAVDRLRASAGADQRPGSAGTALVLAAADPANPYGAALPWPGRPASPGSTAQPGAAPDARSTEASRVGAASRGHQPGRKAGALVVLVDGALVLYVERGGRTLLTWSEQPEALGPAAQSLAAAVRSGALGRLTVERSDGTPVLGSTHPLIAALADAGFHWTPRGLRLRR
jgi:ATP-dependent Lhr-like helicase